MMCLVALTTFAAKRNTILSVRDTVVDNDIVYPESFETDTHELMKNWYLQNYAVLDADVEKRDAGTVSDEEYIKRLQAMPTTIEMCYNQVVRSYIDRYVKRHRTLVEEMLGMSLYYMPIFEQALEKEGMPLELKYLPVIESALNPTAVSRAGAAGLWQFMVGTGKGLGLEVNSLVDERRDPYRSSEKAAIYLKNLFNIYNDWSLAIAAYNCGPANVNKALRRAGGDNKDFWEIYPYLPKETRGYVPAFIAANYVMTYFKRHNISPSLAKKPLITDTVGVTRRVHFNQISKVLNMPIEEIRALNPQYRSDIIPASTERTYNLCLPQTQVYSFIMSADSIYNYRSDLYAQRGNVEPAGYRDNSDDRPFTYETKTVTSYHKVRKGDNLGKIASQYGMSKSALRSLNGLRGDKVQRGQSLKVTTTKRVKVYHERPAQQETSDDDIKVVHSGDASPSAEELENEQIAEVKAIEEQAKTAPKKTRRTAVEEPVKADKPAKQEKVEKVENSDQWRERNERYAAKETKKESREDTYKKSRSSKSEEARESKRDKKRDRDRDRDKKRDKKKRDDGPQKGSEYTIKKGENLSKIAEKAGVTVEELQKANGIKGDKIKAGDAIKIPKAKKGKKKKK